MDENDNILCDISSKLENCRLGKSCNINDLPPEVLVKIFNVLLDREGEWELLKIAGVCKLWQEIVSSPRFWVSVEVDDDSIIDFLHLCQKKWLVKTEHLLLNSASEGMKSTDFPLIFQSCPNLKAFAVDNFGPVEEILNLMSKHCNRIENLALWRVEDYDLSTGFNSFLNVVGKNIKKLVLKQILTNNAVRLMFTIADLCPNIQELTIENTCSFFMIFPIAMFQVKCSKLSAICLTNFNFCLEKKKTRAIGFPHLITLCCRFSPEYSGINDLELIDVLKGSPKLKRLDITGSNITIDGLKGIEATDLEELYFAGSQLQHAPLNDFLGAINRWEHSLKIIGELTRDMSVSLADTLSAKWPFPKRDSTTIFSRLCE